MQTKPKPPFDHLEATNGTCVADGWGLKIHVRKGHLIIEDGIGQSRRVRRYHKATSGLSRLIILGHSGYQTLEAIRWLHDAKISTIHIDTDGVVLSATSHGIDNPSLRRAQALAPVNEIGLKITRDFLARKLEGQRSVAQRLSGSTEEITECLQAIQSANTLGQLRLCEAQGAMAYWATWSSVEMNFPASERGEIPDHWRIFDQRRSNSPASGRKAINPINAILNYLYALLEAEAVIAIRSVGLDPGLGILHVDKYARDSFALDLMESARPDVDSYVADLVEGHVFTRKDFVDTRWGSCRIARPLAHLLSETCSSWRDHLAVPAENATTLLAETPGIRVRHLTTPLTRSNHNTSTGPHTPKEPAVRPRAICARCGCAADDGRRLCRDCGHEFQDGLEWSSAGRDSLAIMRRDGDDPAHGGEAALKRGDKNRKHQLEVAEWNAANFKQSDVEFVTNILPGLRDFTLREIANATGLSVDYCSKIRRGLKVPHSRHWKAFAALGK